jgi:hypothetical protein
MRMRLSATCGESGRKEQRVHVAIRRYQLDPGSSVQELMRRVNEGFIPIIRDAPGLLAYYALDSGGGTVTWVSIFEDRAGAEESNRMATDWVRQNLASMLPNPPEITAGEVGAYEATPTGPLGRVTDTVGGVTDRLLGGGRREQEEPGSEEPRRRRER